VSLNRENTLSLIQKLKSACQIPEIAILEEKLKVLRSKSKNLRQAAAFKILLDNYASDFQNINDSKLSYLKREYLIHKGH